MAAVKPHLKKPKLTQRRFYICDDHFDDSCFHNDNVTNLVDGKLKVNLRKVKRLKENSVPMIFHVSVVI